MWAVVALVVVVVLLLAWGVVSRTSSYFRSTDFVPTGDADDWGPTVITGDTRDDEWTRKYNRPVTPEAPPVTQGRRRAPRGHEQLQRSYLVLASLPVPDEPQSRPQAVSSSGASLRDVSLGSSRSRDDAAFQAEFMREANALEYPLAETETPSNVAPQLASATEVRSTAPATWYESVSNWWNRPSEVQREDNLSYVADPWV